MQLSLIEKKNLEGDIYLFTFAPKEPLMWKAGQQMVFTLEHLNPDNLGIKRTLSIASAPFEKNIIVLTHCGEQASTFKKALKAMREGDTIEAGAPEGDFIIKDPEKQYTLIAAGVGIAAYRSMLMDLDYHNLPINITLIYSHTSENFPFKDEIEELLERHENFQVFYTIDPKEIDRGRIKEAVVGLDDNPVYMSGVYIRKIATMLDHRDVSPRRIVHDGRATAMTPRQEEIQAEETYLNSMLGE